MPAPTLDVIVKRFDQPDEIRVLPKGRFEPGAARTRHRRVR